MIVTWMDLQDKSFKDFWDEYDQAYPDLPTKEIYYEVLVDFWEDAYNEELPLRVKQEMAHDYLMEHKNDY